MDVTSISTPLFAQILSRLRKLETLAAQSSSQELYVMYTEEIPLESAINGLTIVFEEPTTLVSSTAFQTAPDGSIFSYGNLTESEVTISDGVDDILVLVPKEFSKLIKYNGSWYGL